MNEERTWQMTNSLEDYYTVLGQGGVFNYVANDQDACNVSITAQYGGKRHVLENQC